MTWYKFVIRMVKRVVPLEIPFTFKFLKNKLLGFLAFDESPGLFKSFYLSSIRFLVDPSSFLS